MGETLQVVVGVAVLAFVGALVYGIIRDKIEVRPFRVSGLLLAGLLVGALWMVLHFDVVGVIDDPYARGFVNGSIIMAVLTGLVTAVNRVFDDGGESDAVKVVRDFVDYMKTASRGE